VILAVGEVEIEDFCVILQRSSEQKDILIKRSVMLDWRMEM